MNDILLNEHFGYDEAIMESLMYEDVTGRIKDSGKSGDERIYLTLGWMEKEYNVNL